MRLTDLPDTVVLAVDKGEVTSDGRHQPPVVSAAALAGFAETIRLDPKRIELGPEPSPPARSIWRGPIGSLVLHLLPLLALISWLRPPLEIPQPIPIQLVIEQPPPPQPPPPAQPKPPVKPPPGLRASDDLGEVGPPSPKKGTETAPPTQGEPHLVAPPLQTAATPVEPPPLPPVEAPRPPEAAEAAPEATVSSPPRPAPPKQQTAMHLLKQEGLELPLPVHPDRPHEASASARYPGPNATRDEYCAYALTLTLRHLDLLPLSLLGARRGDTSVMIRLREDGSIVAARVVGGSGYLDIDERVAQMVMAVGQFPPLPVWLPGPTADFTFHLHFPHPSER